MVAGDVAVLGMCDYLAAEIWEIANYNVTSFGRYSGGDLSVYTELAFADIRSFHASLNAANGGEAESSDFSEWLKIRYGAFPLVALSEAVRDDEEVWKLFKQFGLLPLLFQEKRQVARGRQWGRRKQEDTQREKRKKKKLRERAKAKWLNVVTHGLGVASCIGSQQAVARPNVASLTEFFLRSSPVDKLGNQEGAGTELLETVRQAWGAVECPVMEEINATEKLGNNDVSGAACFQVMGALVLLDAKWKQDDKFKLKFVFDDKDEEKELQLLVTELFGEGAISREEEEEEPDDEETDQETFDLMIAQARRTCENLSTKLL